MKFGLLLHIGLIEMPCSLVAKPTSKLISLQDLYICFFVTART